MNVNERRSKAFQYLTAERDELKTENAKLVRGVDAWSKKAVGLEKERDQLAAQVARLRDELKYVLHCLTSSTWQTIHQGRIEGLLSESPPEALLALKREWLGPTIPVLERAARIFCDHSCAEELTRLTAILEDSK